MQSPALGAAGSWVQNEPIKIGGTHDLPTQSDAAMVIFMGTPGVIVNWPSQIGAAWFDGNQWTADETVPALRKDPGAPVAVVANNVLHVFFQSDGMLWHLMRTTMPFNFAAANWTQQATNLPVTPLSATVADDGTILVLCSPRSDSDSEFLNYLVADPPDDPTNWSSRLAAIEPAHGSPLPTNDSAMATDILGTVNLVYRAHGKGASLFFGGTDPADKTTLQEMKAIPATPLKLVPSFNVQINLPSGKSQKAKIQSSPCLFRQGTAQAFLAHQGQSSNDIWLGVFQDMSPQ